MNLTSIEGQRFLVRAERLDHSEQRGHEAHPGRQRGSLYAANGSTVTINSSVNNAGQLYTGGVVGAGGNTLNITGSLTNQVGGQVLLGYVRERPRRSGNSWATAWSNCGNGGCGSTAARCRSPAMSATPGCWPRAMSTVAAETRSTSAVT